MSIKKMTAKVDAVRLLIQLANDSGHFSTQMGIKMIISCLEKIAKRACELDDKELLEACDTLCIVSDDDEDEKKK